MSLLVGGVAARRVGTTRGFQMSTTTGAFAGLAMGLNGARISIVLPHHSDAQAALGLPRCCPWGGGQRNAALLIDWFMRPLILLRTVHVPGKKCERWQYQ
ncbi:LrgB family protein [Jeongeupia wiesaeckerbachi]|uniref:LrgB family protein n=1 Tax=Jeongeupia wiesaeckerbachi TaxID=3051218 RepID=UPI003D8067C2